jgi:hypothetical protein
VKRRNECGWEAKRREEFGEEGNRKARSFAVLSSERYSETIKSLDGQWALEQCSRFSCRTRETKVE